MNHQIGSTVPNTTSQILAIQQASQPKAKEINKQHTSHSKAEVEVFVVMGQVIFLHLAHVLWQLRVMQPLMVVSRSLREANLRDSRIVHAIV